MKATYGNIVKKREAGGGGINLTLLMAVGLIIGGLSIAFTSLTGQRAQTGPAPVVQNVSDILTSGAGTQTGYADRIIASAQDRVKGNPDDYKAYAELGLAFQQKARETNDPSYYTQAEAALKEALAIKPDYYDAMAGMGTLDLSLHEFRTALDWGLKAQAVIPTKAYAYGVVGDAQVELGNYEGAVGSFQRMIDLRPDLGSYSRVSYARELYGDVPGAIEAMQQAIRAGSPAAENTAWCRYQLGNLYFNSGQLDKAEQAYNESLMGYPDYLHAYAGLAQVRWAQGKTGEAIDLYKQAVATVPLPQYLTALGDLYTVAGNTEAAKEQYDTVLYIFKVFEAGGVNVDIEKAAFLAEHDMDIPSAVTMAEAAATTRQDVNTLDTLAWTYYKAGRYDDAQAAMQEAMRLGTQNALFFYHMGMIEKALGNEAAGQASIEKALATNPHFSILHAQQAADLVRR
jgi:tetratricopeptide (TPR) repeat protein